MAAVESARRAFPNHVKRKENSTKPHSSIAAFGTENTAVAVNGQFESWIEEDVREVKEIMDERVSDKKKMSVLGEIDTLLAKFEFRMLCLVKLMTPENTVLSSRFLSDI